MELADRPKAQKRLATVIVWTPKEVGVFMRSVTGDRLAAMWRAAAMTGMRRSEICGLYWADLDLEQGAISVRRAVVVAEGLHPEVIQERMATARSRPRSIPTATSYSLEPLRGPNGVTRPLKKEVVVDAGLEGAQLIKTTIHELAHVLMHARDGHIDCRGRVEVEAESVANVAGWAERSSDPERTLLATEERVVSYSRRVLDDFKRFHSFLGTVSDYSSTSYVVRAQKDSLRGGSPGQAPVRSVFPDS